VPDPVRESYEDAAFDEQYAGLGSSLPAAASAITAVGAATAVADEDRGPFGDLGEALLGIDDTAQQSLVHLTAGEVPEAQAAADEVTSRASWVMPLGVGLPVVVLLLVGAGWPCSSSSCDGVRHSFRSMRVLPRVLGLTRSRSRNSATPSS